jgi:indolepyruvate ferredoxin oxidoreductase
MALQDPRDPPPAVTLDDKYKLTEGRVFMSGTQALVRLPLIQIERDRAAGLNTGGFISGYRGSPLGTYDQELWRAKKLLKEHDIVFQSGVNEDLAMTAVWGSQQVGMRPTATKDGVFGIWYGKGPGLDRSMDVLKHANAAGSSPQGGVLAIVGDDHGAKSSTLPHQSDHNFKAAFVPFLYPASVHEYVEMGLLGLAMSRFTGAWVGFKATADTVETSVTVDLASEKRQIILPPFDFPEGGVHIRANDIWREEDTRLQLYKGFAAMAFAKANKIDRLVFDSPKPRFGIISTGKAYSDVMEALDELGIDAAVAADIGLRVYKVGMPWPLEPDGVRHFCEGLEEVLVVEEKREFIEHQLKWQLYNWDTNVRPRIVGKQDEKEGWLLRPDNELTLGTIARIIADRLSHFYVTDRIKERLAFLEAREVQKKTYAAPTVRSPYFCAGCPHNTSTKVPDGSRAMAGIGCHIMALWMDRAETFTQMGGEGCTWIGEAPFTTENHVFVNLGDGTYFHSGLLAIRQSVAAEVNVTYKILYNDAVAMTGGQHVDGELTVEQIAQQLVGEGLARIIIVAEDPDRHVKAAFPAGVEIRHRDEMENTQKELRDVAGTTAIVFDQTCAAEKRRRRKRGQFPDPDKRIFINKEVCEGCGDCSVQSNCVAVEPVETEFGRKRMINQSSCNKDFSCVKGFCPSFVEVSGAKIRKPDGKGKVDTFDDDLPLPQLPAMGADYNILVTGIGGTGVLTISALLGMAAHLEGKASATADMAGLAQKGGAVYSHVRLGETNDVLRSPRIITGGADLLFACDAVTGAGVVTQDLLNPKRTAAVVNSNIAPVSDFVRNRDFDFKTAQVERSIRANTNPNAADFVQADRIATAIMGDAIAANMMLLGYAWQKGLVPLKLDSLLAAIKLNAVAIAFNNKAFSLGRLLAHDPRKVEALVDAARGPLPEPPATKLEDIIAKRVADLVLYQDATYSARYASSVRAVIAAEQRMMPGSETLSIAVARYLYKLMAIKDEYEVARLYTDGRFEKAISAQFSGDFKQKVWLSPPLLSKVDPNTGRPEKKPFGPWIFTAFRMLAGLKKIRGSRWDLFARTAERKQERALLADYEQLLPKFASELTAQNHGLAVQLASLPDQIRGFGPVKEASVLLIEKERNRLMSLWPMGTVHKLAAE